MRDSENTERVLTRHVSPLPTRVMSQRGAGVIRHGTVLRAYRREGGHAVMSSRYRGRLLLSAFDAAR